MKNLKFESYDALIKFFESNKHKISEAEIIINNEIIDSVEVVESIAPIMLEYIDVSINTLSDAPILSSKIGTENIIYVNECIADKNSCSTTKLTFLDRSLWLNVCDYEGVTKVNLDIAIGENVLYNVPFIVKTTTEENRLEVQASMLI